MIALARGRPPRTEATRRGVLMPMAWRALAIVLLLSVAMRESWVLRVDFNALFALSSDVGGERYGLRERLVPVCAILAMIGMALGMGAGLAFARSDPRRPRPYWLFVPLVALAAVLFMGLPNREWSVIPQLILVALTAVSNALPPPAPRLEGVFRSDCSARESRRSRRPWRASGWPWWSPGTSSGHGGANGGPRRFAAASSGSSRSRLPSRPGSPWHWWRFRRFIPACSTASD